MIDNRDLLDKTELHDQYLSFYDMQHHPLFAEAWKNQDEEAIEKILEELGADLDYGYTMDVLTHRSRIDQKVVENFPRWSFKEKSTKEWIKNHMAVEDVVRHTGDVSLRVELMTMGKRFSLGDAQGDKADD